ncbi:MAG: hypothetical protein KBI08_13520 [Sphingobium sp.]|nr:hypothetical protein [Sphingobium sp.]MBP9159131.1 hypothetical protein [Sphingobium sp.]
MADDDDETLTLHYRFGTAKGEHSGCKEFILDQVDGRHRGRYTGLRSSDYISSLRNRGGIFLERDGEVQVFIPSPVRRGRGLLLPFPIIAASDENFGLQCFGHLVQLVNAMCETRMIGPLIEPYIIFPDNNLPSPKLVHMLGLCDPMPDRQPVSDLVVGRNHRFDIRPTMFPGVIAALINRDPAWVGAACAITRGSAGKASIQIAPHVSPFTRNRLHVFTAIAARKLSVIGLPDIPSSQFGA